MDDQTGGGAGGPDVLPESPRANPVAGELATETLDYDGGRQVMVYVPHIHPRRSCSPLMAEEIAQWSGFLEAAGCRPRSPLMRPDVLFSAELMIKLLR